MIKAIDRTRNEPVGYFFNILGVKGKIVRRANKKAYNFIGYKNGLGTVRNFGKTMLAIK